MQIFKLKDFTRGWIIGDFEPSILRTKDFEIGILEHKKGENWSKHYHELADEYNILIYGKMIIQNKEMNAGDIFVIEKNEIADPVFLEDCLICTIKTPSIPGDKYIV